MIKKGLLTFQKGHSAKEALLKNFLKIHRKTSAPEFLCNKVAGLEPATLFIS